MTIKNMMKRFHSFLPCNFPDAPCTLFQLRTFPQRYNKKFTLIITEYNYIQSDTFSTIFTVAPASINTLQCIHKTSNVYERGFNWIPYN